jgi:hypothetical protein
MKLMLDAKLFPNKHAKASFRSSMPFIENTKAILIHRPRAAALYQIESVNGKKYAPHLAVKCYCGNTFCGSKKIIFHDTLNNEMIVCARCEKEAIKAGLPSSSDICGKHVHTGGVKAFKNCCGEEQS